ncbi:hypothetical protein H6F74_15900 [Trichocoleus sp. FACHB-90]|uniref:hypothetical protein n=1 Tax=Cyanophyceae TaxID=3028117 RepID=UPI001688BEFA|nr:hypothetical protein [Trichocoleus sp. FACHB-90]MBD1927714.1 hypothetical protein [Trichocoleus sp. FACHB-90]
MKTILKPLFAHITGTCALLITSVSLFGGQTPAAANPEFNSISPAQAQQFNRDLIPSSSQEFFRQGREKLEREIEILNRRRLLNSPILKNDNLPRVEDSFPEKESDFRENSNN